MISGWTRRATGAWAILGLLAMAATTLGCGINHRSLCEEVEDCREGNEQDIDACVVTAETSERLADDIGCQEEYDTYFDCYIDKASCESETIGLSCQTNDDCPVGSCNASNECERNNYGLDSDDCEAEQRALSRCFNLD